MAKQFRSDNIGSLLRPPELLQARAAYREGKLQRDQLRDIEDRSILKALDLQKAAGVEVFTDGEYRRDIFTADITQAVDGLIPGKTTVSFEWRGAGSELAKESKEGNLQFIVGGKLRKKNRFTPGEAPFLRQHAPGPLKSARRRRATRDKPLQAWGNRQGISTIHDMLQDVAMIMRGEVQR
jgi:5-methyltetrahydropteroyltriglutamate--homocysteine methyltransferase